MMHIFFLFNAVSYLTQEQYDKLQVFHESICLFYDSFF